MSSIQGPWWHFLGSSVLGRPSTLTLVSSSTRRLCLGLHSMTADFLSRCPPWSWISNIVGSLCIVGLTYIESHTVTSQDLLEENPVLPHITRLQGLSRTSYKFSDPLIFAFSCLTNSVSCGWMLVLLAQAEAALIYHSCSALWVSGLRLRKCFPRRFFSEQGFFKPIFLSNEFLCPGVMNGWGIAPKVLLL